VLNGIRYMYDVTYITLVYSAMKMYTTKED